MPLGPPTIPIFEASFLAHLMLGPGTTQLAAGCANGLQQYMSGAGCQTISIDVGTLGAGTGIGAGIILPEPVISGIMTAMFLGNLIIGPFSPVNADAIAMGISLSLATAIVETVNPGVGVGGGIVKCIPQGTGAAIFTEAFIAAGMKGPSVAQLGAAVGEGLDASILSATGAVVIVGPPNILPGAGVGIGTVT